MKTIAFSVLVIAAFLGGCGDSSLMQGSGTTGLLPLNHKQKSDSAKEQKIEVDLQETRNRWNVVADGVTVPTGVPGADFNFLWTQENDFPHPTFKGGSYEAYEAFSQIYIAFFNRGDNFDYIKANNLLDRELDAGLGLVTSFREIAELFSESQMLSADTRAELKRILVAMTPNYSLTEL